MHTRVLRHGLLTFLEPALVLRRLADQLRMGTSARQKLAVLHGLSCIDTEGEIIGGSVDLAAGEILRRFSEYYARHREGVGVGVGQKNFGTLLELEGVTLTECGNKLRITGRGVGLRGPPKKIPY